MMRPLLGLATLTVVSFAHAQSPLQDLLSVPSPQAYHWFASTDTKHKNHDYLELKPGETRHIPLAAGRLERLWCTATEPDHVTVRLFNGSPQELLADGHASVGAYYEKAFVLYPKPSESDFLYLTDGAALVVTNHAQGITKFFYQAAVRPAANPRPIQNRGGAINDELKSKAVAPGERWACFAPKKPSIIDQVEITLNPTTLDTWRNVWLSARLAPGGVDSIRVPLLAFTGQFFRVQPVSNALASFDGKKLVIHVPMPVQPGTAQAGLTLVNQGGATVQATVSVSGQDTANPPPYAFCAIYGSRRTQRGHPVRMVQAVGAGLFAGLALGIEPAPGSARRSFAYLEGNETITADGKTYEGTGTEDFFNSAWYFPDKPFAQPYHGLTFKNKLPPQVSMYRLMIPDALPFRKSLTFDFEHGNHNNSDDLLFRWIAFWYQQAPLNYQVVDTLSSGAPAAAPAAATTSDTGRKLAPVIFGILGLGIVAQIARRRVLNHRDTEAHRKRG